ncbi:unnamed protein product [Candidula unifasciata]|uniref:tRNA(His) guanylyltransferase n=1 Tax=Candidula unifasciata TaxID=100452 RepID=A0A8S3ZCT3_9EUPU|nr:unnamed protein product [Candidula unifasciata]
MALSRYEYVKNYEIEDRCLLGCWIVVRIDGKAFRKFTDAHSYLKPNDDRGLGLMTRAAQMVMADFTDIVLAYGQSDEFSFVFHKNCKIYNRRASKLMSNVVSLFASSFVLYWPEFFDTQELQYPPSFDSRVVLYPTDETLKDYLSWRQVDCHINNLYNTCFWKLVQEKGLSPREAGDSLNNTFSDHKNELLFKEFNINYNSLPELYRKGTVIIRNTNVKKSKDLDKQTTAIQIATESSKKDKTSCSIVLYTDIIGSKFWEEHPNILK